MVTRSEAPDLAVDELKRRGRRRLVGAIVLVLAAAVSLPLLLESEPKPLGDEVSIQIPPIDNSKFVNPLSPGKGGEAKGSDAGAKNVLPPVAVPPAAPSPPSAPTKEPQADSGSAATTTAPPSAPAPPPSAENKSGETKAGSPPPAPAAPVVAPEAKKQSAVDSKAGAKATTPPSDAAQSGGAYVVQVAAYTDRYGALAQVRKLKRAGYPAYVEATPTDKGDLQRVRVGPYASRDTADAARAKLKSAGYDAIVARAR